MKDAYQLQRDLQQFIGTERYYYADRYNWLAYTDGVKYFFEKAGSHGAYWLLDWFGGFLKDLRKKNEFMTIDVTVKNDHTFKFKVTDGNEKQLLERGDSFTDLPAGIWRFYCQNGVLMLTSEY